MTATSTHRITGEDGASLDPRWLTEHLETAGIARGATVEAAELVTFIGTGQMGRNARFALTWDQPDGRPATVVAKFPTDDVAARTNAFEGGSYAKEHLFYTTLRPTVGVRAPHVWATHFDAVATEFVFVMEDLAESAQGDQFRGLTVDEAALAVEQAVALHAPRWGDPAVETLIGRDPDGVEKLKTYYRMMVDPALVRLEPHLDAGCAEVARRLTDHVGTWLAGSDTPFTLTHMDFRPDNLLFGTTPTAPPLVVVDWQTIGCNLGANDVAYLIGGSFEPADRAGAERALVEEYRTRLVAAGVDYAPDACWRDYRIGSVWGVVMSIIATILAAQTERGDRMLGTMLRRHALHALDLEALELLEAMA